MEPSVIPKPPKTPELVPVFLINLKLNGAPEQIFANATRNKVLNLAQVIDGTITTVPNKYNLELDVKNVHGFDDITNHIADGYSELDCKLYGTTHDGAGVYVTYYGLVHMLKPTVDVLTSESSTSEIEDVYLTCNPHIHFDELVADKYKWAIKENFIGKGRFVRDASGTLYVQYFVYVIRH